jgi:hypothetical protein
MSLKITLLLNEKSQAKHDRKFPEIHGDLIERLMFRAEHMGTKVPANTPSKRRFWSRT